MADDCFIYGSNHAKMPRRDAVERALGVVDYVLLEGFNARDWRELVRRDWRTAIVVVGLLTYFKILHLIIKAAGLYYRLRHGTDFKGDMRYVEEPAERMGKRVEIVDENLLNIYEKSREAFMPRLAPILLFGFVVYGLCIIVGEFLAGHYVQAIIYIALTTAGVVGVFVAIFMMVLLDYFFSATMTIRDRKLIDRVQELINQGHKVLVVRGDAHVDYIVDELRRRGIECEDLS